jgi:hypothetical protein
MAFPEVKDKESQDEGYNLPELVERETFEESAIWRLLMRQVT